MHGRSPDNVAAALRNSGVIVIMLKAHACKPEDIVTTVRAIHSMGYFPEITFRIDIGMIREAMSEINRARDAAPPHDRLLVGVGSVTEPGELEAAIDMGFDMVVSPDNAFEGFGKKIEFVRMSRQAGVFSAPGAMTPGEFRYWLMGEDGISPDAIKVFPASVYGPDGLGGLLDPYQRDHHNGKIIVPTGGVNADNGQAYRDNITRRGFDVALAMSEPMSLVLREGKPGDEETILRSLRAFRQRFQDA